MKRFVVLSFVALALGAGAAIPPAVVALGSREDTREAQLPSVSGRSYPGNERALDSPVFVSKRHGMVDALVRRGIRSPHVIAAMRAVPRHLFVPPSATGAAYEDFPLAIGYGQTISAPYVVAYMTEVLDLRPGMKVLEVGTGSGYQAAVLAAIIDRLYSVEIIPELAREAAARLGRLGYDQVSIRTGDGYYGWTEEGPFDAMIVTAAADHIPPPLLDQLARGGRMVIPVGPRHAVQTLLVVTKRPDGTFVRTPLLPVRFVPMTGRAEAEE